jgi:hypothetical protein
VGELDGYLDDVDRSAVPDLGGHVDRLADHDVGRGRRGGDDLQVPRPRVGEADGEGVVGLVFFAELGVRIGHDEQLPRPGRRKCALDRDEPRRARGEIDPDGAPSLAGPAVDHGPV